MYFPIVGKRVPPVPDRRQCPSPPPQALNLIERRLAFLDYKRFQAAPGVILIAFCKKEKKGELVPVSASVNFGKDKFIAFVLSLYFT